VVNYVLTDFVIAIVIEIPEAKITALNEYHAY
jgi:hypothetical protein